MTTTTITLTIGKVITLVGELRHAHDELGHWVERAARFDLDQLAGPDRWTLGQALESARRRHDLADLIMHITGESFGDPMELSRVEALAADVARVEAGESAADVARDRQLMAEAF